ncbi:MAG: hypothetical protein U0893_18480 [Chloroflexota bacterium]
MERPPAGQTGPRPWLEDAWLPTLVVVAGYALVLFVTLRAFDFNPSGPIRIGDFLPADRFWTPELKREHGVGYDGQWFFYIAHDPMLRAPDPETFLDLPAYRYARILYPTLAWMLALGQPAGLPWSLLAVNLLGVIGGTLACIDLMRQLGANRWLALAYAFSPPVLIGFTADLAEPVALALVVGGIALALRGRHWLAGIALALAVLAREPSILLPLGFGLYALALLDWRRARAYLLPLAAPIAWHLWILVKLGSLPSAQSPSNFGIPFGGAYYRLGLVLGWHAPMLGETAPPNSPLLEAAIVGISAGIILIGLTKVLERRDVFAWLLWLQAALAVGTGPLVWADLYSYGRVLGLLYFAYGVMVLTKPQRAASFAAGVHEWTTFVPGRAILVTLGLAPVTSPDAPAFGNMKRSERPF